MVGALLSTSVVFAQEKTAEEIANKKVEKLTEIIDLTEEQASKIQTLTFEFVSLKRKIKTDETISAEDKKTQIKDAKKASKEQFNKILTEEQLTKLKELKEEHKNMDPQKKADKMTKHMTEELELTDDQVERVKVLNLKVAEKIKAIKEDETMSKEKKKEFIKGNMKDHKNVMKSILTADQFVKFEEMSEKMKSKHEKSHQEMH